MYLKRRAKLILGQGDEWEALGTAFMYRYFTMCGSILSFLGTILVNKTY